MALVRGTRKPNPESHSVRSGAVAILDVLGTKCIWASASITELAKNWESLLQHFRSERLAYAVQPSKKEPRFDLEVSAFSDTVILTASGSMPESDLIAEVGSSILGPLVNGLIKGLLIRGVISFGQFYRSRDLVFGPAVDEAAAWYEKPDWIGVSLTPSAAYIIEKSQPTLKGHKGIFVRYDLPFHDNQLDGSRASFARTPSWVLWWPPAAYRFWYDTVYLSHRPGQSVTKSEANFRRVLLDALGRAPITPEIHTKHLNTLQFFDMFKPRKVGYPKGDPWQAYLRLLRRDAQRGGKARTKKP